MRHFRSLFSPALGLTLANNFSINVEPFDMILKVQSEVGKTHTLVSMKETH